MHDRCLVPLAGLCILLARDLRALQPREPESCDPYQAAFRADSNNLEAAVNLGRCIVRDESMIAPGGDSTRLMFRTSWSTALRALRHVVAVDPGYSSAYRPLFRILLSDTRDGCSYVTGGCGHVSPVVRDGDTVITIPRLVPTIPGIDPYDEVIRESAVTRRANLTESRALAERWVAVAPTDRRPHEYLGRSLLMLGDPAAASVELERAAALGTPASRRVLFYERFEALVKSNGGVEARQLLDEAASDPGRDTSLSFPYSIAGFNALLGRHRPPQIDSARRPQIDTALRRRLRAQRDSIIRNAPRTAPQRSFRELLAARDTAAARSFLAEMDTSLAARDQGMWPRVNPAHLASAEYHLALADTVRAEAQLAWIEQIFHGRYFRYSASWSHPGERPWLGHAWLLTGDVAAARGRRDDAERMYRRVIGLWAGGDPEVTPVVEQARSRLGTLPRR